MYLLLVLVEIKYFVCVQFCLKGNRLLVFYYVFNRVWMLDFSNIFLASIEIMIFLPKCINMMNQVTKVEGISYYPLHPLLTPFPSEAQVPSVLIAHHPQHH